MKEIYLENKIKSLLEEKLWKKEFSYFLFGSRVMWDYRKNSDYDIWILGKKKLDFRKYIQLKRFLDDNINFPIDLVDFNRVDDDFKKIALKKIKIWNNWENIKLTEKN